MRSVRDCVSATDTRFQNRMGITRLVYFADSARSVGAAIWSLRVTIQNEKRKTKTGRFLVSLTAVQFSQPLHKHCGRRPSPRY